MIKVHDDLGSKDYLVLQAAVSMLHSLEVGRVEGSELDELRRRYDAEPCSKAGARKAAEWWLTQRGHVEKMAEVEGMVSGFSLKDWHERGYTFSA